MDEYYITAEAWAKLFEFFQDFPGIYTKNEGSVRIFAEGVFWMMRTGAQWRELSVRYGKWKAVHKRFLRWTEKGVWSALLADVSKDYDGESVMLDATHIRAHACASGYEKGGNEAQALGRSKGGFTTKIHALVDALGNALKFILTPGNRNDITQAPALIEGIEGANVIADKAFDSDAFAFQIERQNCKSAIPPREKRKNPRTYDEHLYRERHLVECFFGKLKNFRRIAFRFDKKATSFMAFLSFASTILWLR